MTKYAIRYKGSRKANRIIEADDVLYQSEHWMFYKDVSLKERYRMMDEVTSRDAWSLAVLSRATLIEAISTHIVRSVTRIMEDENVRV